MRSDYLVLLVSPLINPKLLLDLPSERWHHIMPYGQDAHTTDFSRYAVIFLDVGNYHDEPREGLFLSLAAIELYNPGRNKVCIVTPVPIEDRLSLDYLSEQRACQIEPPITEDKVRTI